MRSILEINTLPFKVTLFSWNNKYLIKCEYGPMEQTYKIAEADVLGGIKELQKTIESETFVNHCMEMFQKMGKGLEVFY